MKHNTQEYNIQSKCAVCGHSVMIDEIGNGDNCQHCGWVQNIGNLEFPDRVECPNLVSLNKARKLYKDYLIRKSQNKTLKVNYSEIEKIVETDSNFCLKKKNMVMALQKSSCELDTITFIRNINKDILEFE